MEPALIEANAAKPTDLDKLARIMLSTQTYKEYDACGDFVAKKSFLRNWYAGSGAGTKKVDSAMRLFDSNETINYPAYLEQAILF